MAFYELILVIFAIYQYLIWSIMQSTLRSRAYSQSVVKVRNLSERHIDSRA